MGGAAGLAGTTLYACLGMDNPPLTIVGFIEDVGGGGADIVTGSTAIAKIMIYNRVDHLHHLHGIVFMP